MLLKALQIQNIGRFASKVPIELAKANVLYAENGRGKSTLAAVLRSLQTGDPGYVIERKTLGSTGVPTCSFLLAGPKSNVQYSFDGKAWSASFPNIEIFDAAFTSQNVYSGSEIDQDHRRNLHKFVLGASNVALAKVVDDLDDRIRATTQEISNAESLANSFCVEGFPLDAFAKLRENKSVEQDITSQEAIVELARSASAIAATMPFSLMDIPSWNRSQLDALLASTLADVEADAENRVRRHIESRLDQNSESWLSRGTELTTGTTCPFCDQQLEGSELIRAYKGYFSVAYDNLKHDITAATKVVERGLSKSILSSVRQVLQRNEALAPSWQSHAVETPTAIELSTFEHALTALHSAYTAAFERKLSSVLEPTACDENVSPHWQQCTLLSDALGDYNAAVTTANSKVAEIKRLAAANSLPNALLRLKELRNQRARYQPDAVSALNAYDAARARKKVLEAEKKKAKEQLDAATDKLFAQFQTGINIHLLRCGCGYSIANTKTVYPGGKPRTDYQLVINEEPVDLATPKVALAPCFKNTLSDGDKSTLAFALFLARLELDTALADKVVVLDDPMTSLDAHRRSYTCEQIRSLAGRCKQLLLLTHDLSFARQVWDDLPKPKSSIAIVDLVNKASLADWDIVRHTQSDYFARHELIREFAESGVGDPVAVAFSLRVLLEGNLRMRFPKDFRHDEWLGDFTKRIDSSVQGDALYGLKPQLEELVKLKDYGKQFHHDQNPASANTKPTETELKAYARRTLAFAAGVG